MQTFKKLHVKMILISSNNKTNIFNSIDGTIQ